MPFSSATALKPSSDEELLRVIKSEIKFAEDCDDHDRVCTAEPPFQILTIAALPISPPVLICVILVGSFQR
jgi:hypothetical protein